MSMALAMVMVLALVPYVSAPAKAADPPVISVQPTDQYAASPAESVAFTVKARGEKLNFLWYYNGKVTGYKDLTVPTLYVTSSENESTVNYPMADGVNGTHDGLKFYCVVSNLSGSVKSNTAAAHIKPRITVQPDTQYARPGETVKFSCRAMGVLLSYQWVMNDRDVDGAVDPDYSFTMSSADSGARIWCRVTDKWGHKTSTRSVTVTDSSGLYPKITQQPKDQYTANYFDSVTFTVKAQGEGLRFIWYWTDGPTTQNGPYEYPKYLTTSTPDSSTMTLYMYDGVLRSLAGTKVFCEVINEAGFTETSNIAVAYIRPEITQQPKDVTAKEGQEVQLSCAANGTKLKYQWYMWVPGQYGYQPIKGATSAAYPFTMSEEYSSARFYCLVTDYWGNTAKTGTAAARMSEPEKITSVTLTFGQPQAGQSSGTVNLSTTGFHTVKSCTGWTATDGTRPAQLQAGEYYTFRATIVPNDGYRFSENLLVTARSSEGFTAGKKVISLDPVEVCVEIGFYASMKFMYQPEGTYYAQNAGDEVQVSAKAYANNGALRYSLYKENGDYAGQANTDGVFTIKAESSPRNYYIEAQDLAGDSVKARLKGDIFTVAVEEKKQLVITKEPDDIGVNYFGESMYRVADIRADGEWPLTFTLYNAETDEFVEESESSSVFVPATVEGSYYVEVKDNEGSSVRSRTFRVYLLERSVIDEVRIYVEEPVGGEPGKVVLLDEEGEAVEISDDYYPDYPEGKVYRLRNCGLLGIKELRTYETGKEYTMGFTFDVKDEYYTIQEGCGAWTAWRFTEDTKFYINDREVAPNTVNAGYAYVEEVFIALDPSQVPAKPRKIEKLEFTFTEPFDGMENEPPAINIMGEEPAAELLGQPVWARQGAALDRLELITGFKYFRPGETYWFTAEFSALDGYKFGRDVTAAALSDFTGTDCAVSCQLWDGILTVSVRYKVPDPVPFSEEGSTIFFEPNGGTPVGVIAAPAGTPLTEPPMPTRFNCRFAGWYRDEELTERFLFKGAVMPDRDITLFAKWIENDVKILRLAIDGQEDQSVIPEGSFTVTLDVRMSDEEAASVWVLLALYDADGRLMGVKEASLKKNADGVWTASVTVDNPGGVARVSVMILNREGSVPLCDLMGLVMGEDPWDDSQDVPEYDPYMEYEEPAGDDDYPGSGRPGGGDEDPEPGEDFPEEG